MVDGTAYHIVKCFKEEKDGHAAWVVVCEWFDGNQIKIKTSRGFQSKLDTLKPHNKTTVAQYVNEYFM